MSEDEPPNIHVRVRGEHSAQTKGGILDRQDSNKTPEASAFQHHPASTGIFSPLVIWSCLSHLDTRRPLRAASVRCTRHLSGSNSYQHK